MQVMHSVYESAVSGRLRLRYTVSLTKAPERRTVWIASDVSCYMCVLPANLSRVGASGKCGML